MSIRILAAMLLTLNVLGQPQPPPPKSQQPEIRYVESGSGVVGVNPAQPYRPIPAGAGRSPESIFGFYLRVLNPHQIDWGTEVDRRLEILRAQSVSNPYFRLMSFQLALILFLLVLCWAWWDKMRRIKWIAAECLTDALNAKSIAEERAVEAIERHNRHMESCNRVIEGQTSGIGGGSEGSNAAITIRELQTELAASRAKCQQFEHELQESQAERAKLDSRLVALEAEWNRRAANPDADLVARLERAESELAGRKGGRKS